jgi:large subunit ribosomal protein L32e
MTPEPEPAATAEPTADRKAGEPTPKRAPRRRTSEAAGPAPATVPAAEKKAKAPAPKAPRRPTLEPELARLLGVRAEVNGRRPKFVRTASHRYARIGRRGSWRRPRGLQSKQRRHYGYRPVVVSVGFRSPRVTRGLTPSGFRPVIVRTAAELEALAPATEAALIARAVGVHRRLHLEEVARLRGIHVLNPITSERKEE